MLDRLWQTALFRDPRHGQMIGQSTLILCGTIWFAFEMQWWRPLAAIGAAQATQFIVGRLMGWRFDWRSPLINALAVTLLLRTEGPLLAAAAGSFAVLSKLIFRIDGRHFFNPGGLAVGAFALFVPGCWVAPGAWGSTAWIAIVAVGLGAFITGHARRLEVPLIFLAAWAALCFARAAWFGDPVAIPLHQMQNGMLVIFAFFMVSDPMTAPWNPLVRAAWVIGVACAGFALQHEWIVNAGPIYGLLVMAPLVPLLNRLFPAPQHQWRRAPQPAQGAPA